MQAWTVCLLLLQGIGVYFKQVTVTKRSLNVTVTSLIFLIWRSK